MTTRREKKPLMRLEEQLFQQFQPQQLAFPAPIYDKPGVYGRFDTKPGTSFPHCGSAACKLSNAADGLAKPSCAEADENNERKDAWNAGDVCYCDGCCHCDGCDHDRDCRSVQQLVALGNRRSSPCEHQCSSELSCGRAVFPDRRSECGSVRFGSIQNEGFKLGRRGRVRHID